MTRLFPIFLAGIFVSAGCKSESSFDGYNRLRSMEEELAQLPPTEQITDQPYLNGKVAVVAFREGSPGVLEGDTWADLVIPTSWSPEDDFVAVSPDEVGTVGRMDCTRAPVGHYETAPVAGLTSSHAALRETCVLTLVDRSIPAVIYRRTFEGPDPADTVRVDLSSRQTSVNLDVPSHEVLAFLRTLPRR